MSAPCPVANAPVQLADSKDFTIFHALKPPAITIHKYLQRIFQVRCARCAESAIRCALRPRVRPISSLSVLNLSTGPHCRGGCGFSPTA